MYDNQPGLAVTSSSVALPNCLIEIVRADVDDDGLAEVQLRVQNVASTRDWFRERGMPLTGRSAVPREPTLGAPRVRVA